MSNMTAEKTLTRREKQPEARAAVGSALEMLEGRVNAPEEWMIHDELLEIITEEALGPEWIDKYDIARALRWLHAKGVVCITHRDLRTDMKMHRVRLLRSL